MRSVWITVAMLALAAQSSDAQAKRIFVYDEQEFVDWDDDFQSLPKPFPPGYLPITHTFTHVATGGNSGTPTDPYLFGAIRLSTDYPHTQNAQLYMWNDMVSWEPLFPGERIVCIETSYDTLLPSGSTGVIGSGPIYIQFHGSTPYFYQNTQQPQVIVSTANWTSQNFGSIYPISSGWQHVVPLYGDGMPFDPGMETWFGFKAAESGSQGLQNDIAYYFAGDNYHVKVKSEVPEPATTALVVLAALVAAGRMRGRAALVVRPPAAQR